MKKKKQTLVGTKNAAYASFFVICISINFFEVISYI